MVGASLVIAKTPKGGWKAYFWGQADGHISDWRGCNFRYAPLDNQPLRGFKTREEAIALALSQFQTEDQVMEAGHRKPGRHLNDTRTDFEFESLYTPDVVERIRKMNENKQHGNSSQN